MKKEHVCVTIVLILFMTIFIFPNVYGNDEESYANMALEYEEKCKYKEAIYYYTLVIKENPDPYWYGRRAELYQKIGLYEEAIDDYNIILSESPDNQIYYLYRGRAYYNLKLYNLAIKDYTKAIELEEKNKDMLYSKYSHADLYFQRALAYKKLGDNLNYEFDLRTAADISGYPIQYYEMQRPREFSNDIPMYLSILVLVIGVLWIRIKKNKVMPSTNQEIGYSAFFFATIIGLITIMVALNITSAHSPPLMVYISSIFFYPIIYSINRYVKNRYNSSIDKNKAIKNLAIFTAIFIGITIFAQIQLNSMKELMWGTYEIFCHSMGNQFILRGIVSYIGPIGTGLGTMLISVLYKKKFGKGNFGWMTNII